MKNNNKFTGFKELFLFWLECLAEEFCEGKTRENSNACSYDLMFEEVFFFFFFAVVNTRKPFL